jgi:hypothetical protein
MQSDALLPEQTKSVTESNSVTWSRLAIVIVITAVIAGISGYILGARTNQNAHLDTQRVSFQPSLIITAQPSIPTPLLSPTQAMVTTSWKTYTNKEQGISFNYLNDWNVSENKQYGYVTLRSNIAPCPSPRGNPFICRTGQHIYITTYSSANNVSITEFINKKYGSFESGFEPTYTYVSIGGAKGLRTSDIPGQFDAENVFVKNNNKIYNITWDKNPAEKQITEDEFNKFLSTFKFIY